MIDIQMRVEKGGVCPFFFKCGFLAPTARSAVQSTATASRLTLLHQNSLTQQALLELAFCKEQKPLYIKKIKNIY